jgi:hypothetical protein
MTEQLSPNELPDQDLDSQKWSRAWQALFGIRQVQVFFPDNELKARVYRLDGDNGYTVQEKTVVSGQPAIADAAHFDHSQNLSYPKKSRRGSEHGRARLQEDDVRSIRAWAATYVEKKETPPWTLKAAEFNVGEGTIRDIVNRRTWVHIHP